MQIFTDRKEENTEISFASLLLLCVSALSALFLCASLRLCLLCVFALLLGVLSVLYNKTAHPIWSAPKLML